MGKKPSEPERLSVTVQQAIELTGLGQNTIYDLISEGTLASTKIGGRRLILYPSLMDLIKQGVKATPRTKRRREQAPQPDKAA